MKGLLATGIFAAAFATGIATVCGADDADTLFRIQHAGAIKIMADPAAARLKTIWTLPTTEELRRHSIRMFAEKLPAWMGLAGAAANTNHAALLQPILEDLLAYPSMLEAGGTKAAPVFMAAAQLPKEQAAGWKKAAEQLKGIYRGQVATDQSGDLMMLVMGPESSAHLKKWRGQLKNGMPKLPGARYMDATINLSRLDIGLKGNLPIARLACSARSEGVFWEGTFTFQQPLDWKPDPWRIPTNSILEPVISFTAANGLRPLLSSWEPFKEMQLPETPNQLCLWASGSMPFMVHAAAPLRSVTNTLQQIALNLPPLLVKHHIASNVGTFFWISNRAEFFWRGLPVMQPNLIPLREPAGDFILGSLFFYNPRGKPAPADLFAQLYGRTNMVYYDWEITQERLLQWNQLYVFLPLFTEARAIPNHLLGQRWLTNAAPHLGNIVTAITYVSPTELKLVRQGHIGLTAFELTRLARWLDMLDKPANYGRLPTPSQRRAPAVPPANTPPDATKPSAQPPTGGQQKR